MKVVCEYCGSTIDSEKNTKCLNCGADLSNNKILKESMNIKLEKEKLEVEKQKIELEHQKREHIMRKELLENQKKGINFVKFLNIGCLIPVIFIILILTFSIISFIVKSIDNNIIPENETITETLVEGNFNTPVSTSTYSVTCDKYEEFEVPYSTPTPGHKYMRFHFIVENISDTDIYSDEKIRAIADGIQCQRKDYYKNAPELPVSHISPGAKLVGYIGFEIPENAKNIQIKYGTYVTINIDMSN